MTDRASLLLIPGLLCDAALWQNQISALKNMANYTVVDTTRHDDIRAIARDVLAAAPRRFALAGLSMGGYVALEIMRQAPERVTRLALLDTSARPDTEEQKHRRRLLLVMAQEGRFKGVTPRLLPMLIHPDHIHDVALTTIIMEMAERVGRDAFFNQQTAILNRTDSRPYLKDIACPTLVLGGRQDAITPPDIVQEIANGIKGARLSIIEECGHLSTLERPDAVNALMKEWLSGGTKIG
ncbi:MAG: alpha/beta fold hydrolase [Alphaproteobacteria bacterium]|nr:alpha/beta fold hydrolase [Alphaproteobacteria bacterium]